MSKAIDMDVLASEVESEIIDQYQTTSIMSYVRHVPIMGGIAMKDIVIKYMTQQTRAAWTAAGYTPNKIKLAFEGFKLPVDTYAQEMQFNESDMAFYQKYGFFEHGISQLGDNLAWTENHAFIVGQDANAGSPHSGYYNYVMDEGTSNGTAVRPLVAGSTASTGAWTSLGNVDIDLNNLFGKLRSQGYNLATTGVLVPEVAAPVLGKVFNGSIGNGDIEQHINSKCGIGVIWMDDDHLPTGSRDTAPTTADFDIWAIDFAEVVFKVARPERVRTIGPYGTVRDTTVEAEKWGTPVFIPRPKTTNVAGTVTAKFYKGVSTIDGIAIA